MEKLSPPEKVELDIHRESLVYRIEKVMRGPMIFLGFVWIILIVLQFLHGLSAGLLNDCHLGHFYPGFYSPFFTCAEEKRISQE
jgi:voltage-gated potassium channel